MNSCYLVDSSIYIFRYYFSGRPSHLSKSGHDVSTVLAFTRWLFQFLEKQKPDQLAFFFDESLGTCFRNDIDSNYKSNRELPDDALAYQLLSCKKIVALLGVPTYASERFEADDLIASAAKHALDKALEPILVTRDKDLAQILREDVGLFWDYGYDDPIGFDSFANEFGISPKRIPEYLAIAGDSADAIIGVKGVGKKTVAALFQHGESWENLKQDLSKVASFPIRGAAGVSKKLIENSELIEHNLRLTQLDTECLSANERMFSMNEASIDELGALFDEFNAPKSLKDKLEKLSI